MKTPTFSKAQILTAMQKTAAKLGHSPSQHELLRLTGITTRRVLTHFSTYRDAVRAAGLEPKNHGRRVDVWRLLHDWGRVTREMGHPPSLQEYKARGKYGTSTLEKRFGRWNKVRERFVELVHEQERLEDWADVLETIERFPAPTLATGCEWLRLVKEEQMQEKPPEQNEGAGRSEMSPTVLPPELQGKKCVTAKMWTILFAIAERRATWNRDLARLVAIRPFADRPLMGAPMNVGPLANAPVNEMGVMCLFVLLAERLGFIIDVIRSQYPDCEARFEVEPGRWQRVWIEFEFESIGFRNHRHDPNGCDVIVCWRHNWPGYPKKLVVVELSRVIAQEHCMVGPSGQFHHGSQASMKMLL